MVPVTADAGTKRYLSAVVHEKKLYVIGGQADGRMLNSMEVFSPQDSTWATWFQCPPMQTKRSLHGAAVAEGKIFVIGGFDGMRDLATCEWYDSANLAWNWADRMSVGRSYFACAATKTRIYAIGGQDRLSHTDRVHKTVEAFELYSDRWFPMPELSKSRLGAAAAVLTNENGQTVIYVCGGSDGVDVLTSVEVFNEETEEWSQAPPMNTPRLSHVAVVIDNKLYVLGGSDGVNPVDTFEVFDPVEGQWSLVMKMGGLSSSVKDAVHSMLDQAIGEEEEEG